MLRPLKNAAEIEGMISSHIRDAVALSEFFSHLEEDIKTGLAKYTELSAAELVSTQNNPIKLVTPKDKLKTCSKA